MLTLNTLGGIKLIDTQGDPVRLRSRKHMGLLLYLIADGRRVHQRRRLCEFFWDSPHPKARHSLSQAVYDITKQLGPVIERGPGGDLGIDRSLIRFDVHLFEHAVKSGDLSAAVQLYGGPFAGNLSEAGTEEFERWVDSERTRLSRLGEIAIRRYVADCEARGQWGEMCVASLRLASMSPLDEDVHRTFMRALWLGGDAASALRHYDSIVTEISPELPDGLSPETEELALRIRANPHPTVDSSRTIDREPPFIGREKEFQVLRELAAEIEDTETSAVVISGEPGIGKSRLVKEFARSLAPSPLRLLFSRCYQAEEELPYSPVVDGLMPLVREMVAADPGVREQFHRLAYLLPDFGPRENGSEHDFVDPAAWRRQLYEEVASFLTTAVAIEPIVWIVDDVQWTDRTSAGLFHYLSRRLAGRPFLLVLTVRNPRGVEELPVLPVGAPKPGKVATRILRLHPLSEEHVREIVQHAEPEGWEHPGAELAVRLSGGNPYYALEVLEAAAESREWAESATDWDPLNDDRLRKVLQVRLGGLDRDGMRLLRAIGVLDRHARPRLVAAVAEITISVAARLAEELYLRSLVVDEQERIAFTNDTMREFVYGEMSSLQRAALHLRAGQALEAEANPAPGALATHFYHGDDWFRSFGYAMEAASAAQAAAGHTEAAHFAAIAAHVAPGVDERRVALEIRADSLFAAGELAEAAACYGEILKAARPSDPRGLVRLLLSLAATEIERCQWDDARIALAASLEGTKQIVDPDERLLATGEYSLLALRRASQTEDDGSASLAAAAVDNAVVELTSRNNPPAATVLTVRMAKAVQVALTGSSRDALHQLNAAAESLPGGSPAQVGRFLTLRGVIQAWLGQWDSAESDFLAERDSAQAKADQVRLATAWSNLACIALERGNWELASDRIQRASEVEATLDENSGSKLPILTNSANLLFYQGFLRKATRAYTLAGQVCHQQENPGSQLEVSSCLGLIALQRGDRRDADVHWRRVRDLQAASGIGVGIRERFKVEWFRAAMLGPSHASLAEAAEREKDRDYPSYLKLLWLDSQILDKPSTNPLEIEQMLREYELSWFCHVARRWSRGASLRG